MIILVIIGILLGALIWGSFLNVVAFRLVHNYSLLIPRSFCPHCKQSISWYDLIPVLSWFILRGRCRLCKAPISFLYPLIELLTALAFISIALYSPPHYWLFYGIFFSALIIITRADIETMTIPPYIIPLSILAAFILCLFNVAPISVTESMLGALLGYCLLWIIAHSYKILRKQEGLGEGDFDILALVGAYLGVYGAWFTLLCASIGGALFGLILISSQRANHTSAIPFGPWLAWGAIVYMFLSPLGELFF